MKGAKFRKYIEEKMKSEKLNQITFSEKVKCNHSFISLLLNEKRKPTPTFISKVCKKFHDEKKIPEFLLELT